jgi:hypothetical protein
VIGVGGGSAVWASSTAPSRSVAGDGDACVLPVTASVPSASSAAVTSPWRSRHQRHAGSGNLVVGIPPTVFIRVIGRWLIVTTNTGAAPQPSDTFYTIADGHAALADRPTRRLVIVVCSAEVTSVG